MRVSFKVIVSFLFALAPVLSDHGALRAEPQTLSGRRGYSPMVTEGAKIAFGVNLDKQQVFKAIDLYADRICTIAQLDALTAAAVKTRIAVYKTDLFVDVPSDGRMLLKECGLFDARFRWVVFSAEDVKKEDGKFKLGGLAVALAGKFDLENLVSFLQKKLAEDPDSPGTLQKVSVLDEVAWRVAVKDASLVSTLDEMGVDLHVASLDGELVLAASSREMLEKQILLYRTGRGRGDALRGFSAKEGDLLRLKLAGLREFVPQDLVPGDWLGIGGLEFDMTMSPDGKVSETLHVHDGSMTILVPAILGAALFPAVSASMRSANSTTMALQGRKLVTGIIQANVERESAGLGPVWPRTWREDDAAGDDIEKKAFKSAAEYFEVLFDMEHYGTANWDPIVDGDLLSTLGKNAVDGKKINPDGLDWCIAANVRDEARDFMPVLVSANVNPALLPCNRFSGEDDRQLPIGRKAGAARSMFDDKVVVLVRKGGASETFKAKDFTREAAFKRNGFDNTGVAHPIVWLTPTGIVETE